MARTLAIGTDWATIPGGYSSKSSRFRQDRSATTDNKLFFSNNVGFNVGRSYCRILKHFVYGNLEAFTVVTKSIDYEDNFKLVIVYLSHCNEPFMELIN